ncbi:transposase [Streptomyces zagrosensis]|uniref:Transposase-like protein n=1 Tax=Streptomyces zagrosensis TaxID=1042984 RepID=A0A7W9V2H0_9ACTN|nr:transposase [Streptomyces zagrosensis]MBB5940275.1 transposase-like protein [Streptomyces zagrosensis]
MVEPSAGSIYSVVFIDCVKVKVRNRQVANRPVYMAVAVTAEGHRDISGPVDR